MNLLMIIAVICAYIVKGMCGFANTLGFSTIMSFQTNNINISPVEVIVGYPSNVIIAWRERKSLSAKIWMPLSCFVMLGSIPGAFFLKNGDTTLIKIIFGFVVVFIGIEMFVREYQKTKRKTSQIFLILIGIMSGVLSGLFGIGALLAAYVSRTTDNNSSFRGNMCIVFIVENSFRIILYSIMGIINLSVLRTAVMLIPVMLIGLSIGMGLSKILDERVVKKVVIIMLILSGVSLIINNISIM